MSQVFGYDKNVKKLKDLGLKEYVDEQLPYGFIYKGAWKGSIGETADYWRIPAPVSGHYVPLGRQMKILFIRVWGEGAVTFALRQFAGGPNAQARGVTDGTIDYPMLEAAGAEVIGPQPLNAPIHVMEGTIDWYIQGVVPTANFYGVAWWGVEAPHEPEE